MARRASLPGYTNKENEIDSSDEDEAAPAFRPKTSRFEKAAITGGIYLNGVILPAYRTVINGKEVLQMAPGAHVVNPTSNPSDSKLNSDKSPAVTPSPSSGQIKQHTGNTVRFANDNSDLHNKPRSQESVAMKPKKFTVHKHRRAGSMPMSSIKLEVMSTEGHISTGDVGVPLSPDTDAPTPRHPTNTPTKFDDDDEEVEDDPEAENDITELPLPQSPNGSNYSIASQLNELDPTNLDTYHDFCAINDSPQRLQMAYDKPSKWKLLMHPFQTKNTKLLLIILIFIIVMSTIPITYLLRKRSIIQLPTARSVLARSVFTVLFSYMAPLWMVYYGLWCEYPELVTWKNKRNLRLYIAIVAISCGLAVLGEIGAGVSNLSIGVGSSESITSSVPAWVTALLILRTLPLPAVYCIAWRVFRPQFVNAKRRSDTVDSLSTEALRSQPLNPISFISAIPNQGRRQRYRELLLAWRSAASSFLKQCTRLEIVTYSLILWEWCNEVVKVCTDVDLTGLTLVGVIILLITVLTDDKWQGIEEGAGSGPAHKSPRTPSNIASDQQNLLAKTKTPQAYGGEFEYIITAAVVWDVVMRNISVTCLQILSLSTTVLTSVSPDTTLGRLLVSHPTWVLAVRRGITMIFYHATMLSLSPMLDRVFYRSKRTGSGDLKSKKRKTGTSGWRWFAVRFYSSTFSTQTFLASTYNLPTFWVSNILLAFFVVINQAGYLGDLRAVLFNTWQRLMRSPIRSRRDDLAAADRDIQKDIQSLHQSLVGNIGGIVVGWSAIVWDYIFQEDVAKIDSRCETTIVNSCTSVCPPTAYQFHLRSVSYIIISVFTSIAFMVAIWLWNRRIRYFQSLLYQQAAVHRGIDIDFARSHAAATSNWKGTLSNRYRVLDRWQGYWRDRWYGMVGAGVYILGVTLAESQEVGCSLITGT